MDNNNFNLENMPMPRKPQFPPADNNSGEVDSLNKPENAAEYMPESAAAAEHTPENTAGYTHESAAKYTTENTAGYTPDSAADNAADKGESLKNAVADAFRNSEETEHQNDREDIPFIPDNSFAQNTAQYPRFNQQYYNNAGYGAPYNQQYYQPYGSAYTQAPPAGQYYTAPQQNAVQQQNSVQQPNVGAQYAVQNGVGQQYGNPYSPVPVQQGAVAAPINQQTKPPKQSTGLKVFLICMGAVFGICLIVFVSMISYSLGQSTGGGNGGSPNGNIIPTQYYGYQSPTEPATHEESDYSDKIVPDYGGLEIKSAPDDKNSEKYNAEYAYNQVSKSVVGVVCYTGEVTDVSQCATQGSGIIISQDGYIITNAHILNNSKTMYALQIVTHDGKTYTAGVVGFDARTDLAVLKADAEGLTPASFENSKDMQVGASVIAVGNPGGIGYQNSLTRGVISAFDRTVPSSTSVKYIQTDASINPGSSGGPLCNMYGNVIGVNTSKIVSEKYEGMCFSIPTETAKVIADDLIRYGYVKGRVKLGITGYAVTTVDRAEYGLPEGIIVESVDENGPLGKSEIQPNDVITKIDGEAITSFGDVYTILEKHKPGDKVTVEVYRSPYLGAAEKTFEVSAVLAEDNG